MGWCPLESRASHPLLDGVGDRSYFYFVHSYALPVSSDTLAAARHVKPFSAVVGKDNFLATQFHPERSGRNGARLLCNFLGLGA